MKTLKRRSEKRKLLKWMACITVAYLLASWGVNGIINPLHYIHSWKMQEVPLTFEENSDGYHAELPENMQDYSYLSFEVADSMDYFFDITLFGWDAVGEQEQEIWQVRRGWNCIDISQLSWNTVKIPWDTVEKEKLCLKHSVLSKYRKTDMGRMLYVFVSFLFFSIFWECVWWVKQRYTK